MTKRILIVDDERDLRHIIQLSLEDVAGWEAITAGSAAEGLHLARSKALDAILLDVSMPEVDGIELFEQLQSDVTTRSIPVIFLTAKVLADDLQRFSTMGIAGVITKPFKPSTMGQRIAEIMGWTM